MAKKNPTHIIGNDIFLTIFEQSPISIQIFAPNGDTVMVNKAWEKLWGVPFNVVKEYNILRDKQLIGRGIMPLVKKAFRGEIIDLPAIKYEPQKTIPNKTRVSYRWTSANMYPIWNKEKKIMYVVLQHKDITEQKTAEEKLVESERFFKSITENSLDGVRLIDEKGNIIYTSPSASQLLGFSTTEYKKMNIFDLIHEEDRKIYRESLADLLAHPQKTVEITYRVKHKNGQIRWFEGSGRNFLHDANIHAIISNFRDVTERVRAENKLWETNQTLNTIIQASPLAVCVLDIKGHVVLWSASAEKMFGWLKHEVMGKPLPIVTPDKKKEFIQNLQTVRQGKPLFIETVRKRKDGSLIPISLSAAPVHDEKGDILYAVAIISDISAKKRNEEEQARLAAIVKSTDDAIISKSLQGIITTWNRSAERLYGFTEKEAVGKPITIIIPKELLKEEVLILKKIGHGESIDHFETVRVRKDGRRVAVSLTISPIKDSKGNIIGASKIARDITDKKIADMKLRESEERLRLALEAGNIGVWDWDLLTNTITWTDNVYTIHGVSKKSFTPTMKSLSGLIHPEDKEKFESAIEQTLVNKAPFTIAFRIITPDNEVRWLTTNAILSSDAKNNPTRLLGATSDITRQKALDQEKSDFLSMASHELKTPITSMKMFIDLLQKELQNGSVEKPLYYATRIRDQANRLGELTNDLLDVSRVETGKLQLQKETFLLRDLVEDTIELMKATTSRHPIVLERADSVSVTADRYRVYQVLINLISNAIKYSPSGKKIVLCIKKNKHVVHTSVQDFGIGIPKNQQKKIFDRLYQVSDPVVKTYPGLGLGLYISKEIIDRHHGEIWVESDKGKGSKFYFTLPLE